MVCREFRVSSVYLAQIRTASIFDDPQIQSLYHTALHDPTLFAGDGEQWSQEALFSHVISRARADLDNNPIYRPQRRTGLRARLEENIPTEGARMGPDRLAALARLPQVVEASELQFRGRIRAIAGRLGMSERETLADYARFRREAPSGRQERATREELVQLGLIPSDPATRYALAQLEAMPPRRAPVMLINRWTPVQPPDTPEPNPVTEIGTSDLSNRVELRHRDGTIRVLQTAEVQARALTQIANQRPLTAHEVATIVHIPDSPHSERSPYAVRCDDCGRFVGERPHECVTGMRQISDLHTVTRDGAQITMPTPRTVHQAVTDLPGGRVDITTSVSTPDATVAGIVRARRGPDTVRTDPETRTAQVDLDDAGLSDTLTCDRCHSTTCSHVGQARLLIRRELRTAGLVPLAEATQLTRDHLLRLSEHTPPVPAPAPRPAAELDFATNPQAFRDAARSGHRDGVPFYDDAPVLDGYAHGARFGIEIEFTGLSVSEAATQLAAAGVIARPEVGGYHSTQRSGWRQWRLERDGTVSGELVTSILSDAPESWGRLQRACQVLTDHGATTHWAGSHTNIGCINFTAEHAWRLAHFLRAHEQDLDRMGRTRGSQRDYRFSSPLHDPGPIAWRHHVEAYSSGAMAHGSMINMSHAFTTSPRLEFRFPDASLDAGTIQAQVGLCAAMTNYVRTHDVPTGQHNPRGTAQREGWAAHATAGSLEVFAERTAGVRSLIDELATTDRARHQLAALWGRGSYIR